MYKKDKNKIIQTGRTGPAGESSDFKIGNVSGSMSGNSNDVKTVKSCSTLSGKLYLLILIGLSVAVFLMLSGMGLNFLNGAGDLNLDGLQENTFTPVFLIDAIKNSQMTANLLISYAGLIAMILVPAAGLVFILVHFTCRKKFNLALTAAGVLFMLILSAVIGLLKS
jgi:hypothetical protein